jgi:glycosyltransferase involved in cell wall biosynthesis
MNSFPKVSVFVPNYNYARYLPECLDSILAQTYHDFEIVIADDGSTDNSHEVLMDYQSRYPEKIHYYWHPGHANKGVAATSNLAISKSQGEYLAWTGSDDVWYPQKLELQVAQLDHDPRLGMVYSYADFLDSEGRILPGRYGVDITADPNPVGRMLQSCHPPAMTVVIRRQCMEEVGGFDETLRTCEDWDLWIRVFALWKVGFIDQPLVKYRIHGNNLSKGIDPKVDLNRILTFYRRLEQKQSDVDRVLLEPRNQAIVDLQMVFHLFANVEIDESIKHLHAAFHKDPSLCEDINFLNHWLSQWKPNFYTPEHNHFGFWVIAHLPPTISPGLQGRLFELQLQNPDTRAFFVQRGVQRGKSQSRPVDMTPIFDDCPNGFAIPRLFKENILKEVYSTLLFESYQAGDVHKTRYYWRKAIQMDRSWLTHRGVLAIGVKAFLGRRMLTSNVDR